jgi:phosphoenolpyruvate carboxylase
VTEPQPITAVESNRDDAGGRDLDKDSPLREDIRMLGRLLGDTIRDQEGADVFDLVERIRINSVRFHRDANETARRELENTLDELPTVEATRIVRAFSYFSHLANIAEDRHHIRRNRAHMLAGSAPRGGTLAFAIGRVIAAGIGSRQLRTWFDTALISPVLTAHPTEVQRKSTMTHEMAIADLLEERDRHDLTEEERDELVDKLHRAVVTLWQTS